MQGYLNPSVTKNQDPYVANTMTDGVQNYLGDKFVKGLTLKDSNGRVLAEVVEVKREPAYRKFIFGNQLVEELDTERKKVSLTVKITTEKYGDVYLFRGDEPLRVNDNLYLNFWDLGAMFTITDFKEI